MTNEERQQLRAAIAEEYGIALYRQYGEDQAAAFLKIDVSTLKRWRRAKKVDYVAMGDRGVRYMGYTIADILMGGAKKPLEGSGAPPPPPQPSGGGNSVLDALAGNLNGKVRKT